MDSSTVAMAACSCALKSISASDEPCSWKIWPSSLSPRARRLRCGGSTLASVSTLSQTCEMVRSMSITETRHADSSISAIAPVRSISSAMLLPLASSSMPSSRFSIDLNTWYVRTPAFAAFIADVAARPCDLSLATFDVTASISRSEMYSSALFSYAEPMVCRSTSPKDALASLSARACISASNSASSPATYCASMSASPTAHRTSRLRCDHASCFSLIDEPSIAKSIAS
mmetsp:Transcript_20308/g.52414  ORF Transcript_20308/g.52414 Transcript_20308/m.52414 type:complete len:230 (+) Transcript_20308:168-857(+)